MKVDLEGGSSRRHTSSNPAGYSDPAAPFTLPGKPSAVNVLCTPITRICARAFRRRRMDCCRFHGGSLFLWLLSLITISEGLALNDAEKPRLVDNLGAKNNLVLRNHGLPFEH